MTKMTEADRELLERAAKAAGLYEQWPEPDYSVQWNGEGLWCSGMGKGMLWNSLTDDGDAFRLAVKLRIESSYHEALEQAFATVFITQEEFAVNLEDCGGNEYAATRRAITRAAAALANLGEDAQQ